MIQTIVCYREKPADATALVYDAQSVSQAMHAKYKAEETSYKEATTPRAQQGCSAASDCANGVCIEGLCR